MMKLKVIQKKILRSIYDGEAVPQLRRLVSGFLLRRPGFESG
jgi:hypothetical protein